jgi:hypothetical protein
VEEGSTDTRATGMEIMGTDTAAISGFPLVPCCFVGLIEGIIPADPHGSGSMDGEADSGAFRSCGEYIC